MAQQGAPDVDEEERVGSLFPSPPPFWRHFTPANVNILEEAQRSAAGISDPPAAASSTLPQLPVDRILALPTEVRYLIPPEPPAEDEEYTVFQRATKLRAPDPFSQNVEWIASHAWDEETQQGPLEGWKYEQLYPSPSASWSSLDRQNYLFRFLRSIILAFLELLGIMSQNPTSGHKTEKLKDILTLVLNMHALINEYRPHQARETLIRLMEQQVERKKAEVEGVRAMTAKVTQTLDSFAKDAPRAALLESDSAPTPDPESDASRAERQRDMWMVMDELVGH